MVRSCRHVSFSLPQGPLVYGGVGGDGPYQRSMMKVSSYDADDMFGVEYLEVYLEIVWV